MAQPRTKPIDAYHQEHHDLFAALRRGDIYNEGDNGAEATLTAILGRMATYSGKVITWDEAIASTLDLSPAEYSFTATPPVVPDANGFYPIPVPGQTDVLNAPAQAVAQKSSPRVEQRRRFVAASENRRNSTFRIRCRATPNLFCPRLISGASTTKLRMVAEIES